MIIINNEYLHLFKKRNYDFLYQISKGLYLSFDKENLQFIGIEMFYLPKDIEFVNKKADSLIKDLINRDILIYI